MFGWLSSHTRAHSTEVEKILGTLDKLGPVISTDDSRELHRWLRELCQLARHRANRKQIFEYLRVSLDPSSDWRVIDNGLRILSALVIEGATKFFCEISRGMHFDVIQRTLILTSYCHDDDRITRLIRSSAHRVHQQLLTRASTEFVTAPLECDEFGLDDHSDEYDQRTFMATPDTSPVDLIDL